MNKTELIEYKKLKQKIRLLEDELREIQELEITVDNTKPKVQSSPKSVDVIGNVVAKIDESKKKLCDAIQQAIEKRTLIENKIDKIDDLLYREILVRRYIACESWLDIAERMHQSERWCYELHARALREIEKIS